MIYEGNKLKEIVFPLGGIGTGSIGLNGVGHLVDWEIFNRPDKGSYNGYTHIAIRAEFPDGRSDTRVLQGDWIKDYMGKYSGGKYYGYGYGPETSTLAGFPHFEKTVFKGEFPFASLTFSDTGFPAEVTLTAFNPFIPQNVKDSALPAAVFDISVKSREPGVGFTVCFTLQNPYGVSENTAVGIGGAKGVFMKNAGKEKDDTDYGDMTLTCVSESTEVVENWYRGGWVDAMCVFWRELSEGRLHPRKYAEPGSRDVSSVYCRLGRESSSSCRFVLTWNSPNCSNYWSGEPGAWKNRYAVLFGDSSATNDYVLREYERLKKQSEIFRDALLGVSLGGDVTSAISSALCVLKSPTVLLLEDGTFYGWEGVHEKEGSCEGTCTHVWSYAYALCFLFPELERSLRECELRYDVRENGAMAFRTKLPLGADPGGFRPCVDGQAATVFKVYREWMISGDDKWLGEAWKTAKRVLSFFWDEGNGDAWDADRDGVLEGRQHHTLDMELFGPSSWLEGMYLAALAAAVKIAGRLGDPDEGLYRSLFENGRKYLNGELFNGKYFCQKIDLKSREYPDRFDCPNYWNEEAEELKYQIAGGSEIDQMLGQWHASVLGLGRIFDPEKTKTALRSMMERNFKKRLRDVPNTLRVFALNDESGSIICDYTGAEKPVIPIPYAEECMTGFEYAFAGLLLSEGMRSEAESVVSAVRDRYDGEKRNPYNEIECGSNYARPMSCFALMAIASGFVFDMPHETIGFLPAVGGDLFTIWGLSDTWGTYERKGSRETITVLGRPLRVKAVRLGDPEAVKEVVIDGERADFKVREGAVLPDSSVIRSEIRIIR